MTQSPVRPRVVQSLPPYPVECSVLTPSGTVVAQGRATPRRREHVAEAYSVQLTDVDPPGVLEALVYADHPLVLLRTRGTAELAVRIDHITGPPQQREFYCHFE